VKPAYETQNGEGFTGIYKILRPEQKSILSVSKEQEVPLRLDRAPARFRSQDRVEGMSIMPVPRWGPRDFDVDLLEDTGPLARDRAELLLSWFEWIEVEAVGEEDLLEGLRYLRGAVMKAAAVEI